MISPASLELRALHRVAEFEACVQLQKEVWGFDDSDLVPVRMFVVAHKVGGQVFGAYDGARLAGYALAVPGDRNGHLYLHSHMLAVAPAYRNAGLGRLLKLRQREDALARGIELMEWTFDPLEIKNAYFNVERLGAIARRYVPNQYGITSSSLHGNLPTDRLVAEWWLRSRRVQAVLAGAPPAPPASDIAEVAVPAEIDAWKRTDHARAAAAQAALREALRRAFAAGFAVLRYRRLPGGGGAYGLAAWDENWNYGPPRTESSQP